MISKKKRTRKASFEERILFLLKINGKEKNFITIREF